MHNVSSIFLILLLLQNELFNEVDSLFFEQIVCHQKSNTKQNVNEHLAKGNDHQVTSIMNFIEKKRVIKDLKLTVIYLF